MTAHTVAQRFVDPGATTLLAGSGTPRKALFLDRDGVINIDRNYVYTAMETQWVPGIFELLQTAHSAGFLPVVVTNQAGIARGFYDEKAFLDYTRWMHHEFADRGTPLLATYFCPHHPQSGVGDYLRECHCRKPEPGMLLAASAEFSIDLSASMLIGDKASDIKAATAAGIGRSELVADPLRGLQALLARLIAQGEMQACKNSDPSLFNGHG